MTNLLCDVYRSSKKDFLYLYVAESEGLARVPPALLGELGVPEKTLTLLLSPGRKLARVSADEVMAAINDQGFYLQLPPVRKSGQEILQGAG